MLRAKRHLAKQFVGFLPPLPRWEREGERVKSASNADFMPAFPSPWPFPTRGEGNPELRFYSFLNFKRPSGRVVGIRNELTTTS